MHISFDDPLEALEEATRLVQSGRWWFREDPFGRRHVYERQFVPGKDPTLRPEEVGEVFATAERCWHEQSSNEFFRTESTIQARDWTGTGRILFHVESFPGRAEAGRVVVVTAFRVRGWQSKG